MKKLLFSVCAFACLHVASFAGHFTVVTSSQQLYSPASSWFFHNTWSSPNVTGGTYSLQLDSRPLKPWHSGTFNGFTYAFVDMYVKVRWHPGAGDPATLGGSDSAFWSMSQSAKCQLNGLLIAPPMSSALVGVIGSFASDPNAYSFNQFFTSGTVLNYPVATAYNVPDNTIIYTTVGGITYGEGVFRITLEIAGNGNIPYPEGGGVNCTLWQSNTLTAIGSYPVL